jgi:hypothetical protein
VDINEAIREVIELTRGETVKSRVRVWTQLAKGLPLIHGDRVQPQQVNPIINAVGTMGGRPTKIQHVGMVANVTDSPSIANGSCVKGIPAAEAPMRHQGAMLRHRAPRHRSGST